VSKQKWHTRIRRKNVVVFPRSFQHGTDDWFLPRVERHTRTHPREINEARKERAEELNELTRIISRRSLVTAPATVLRGQDRSTGFVETRKDSSPLAPMESSESQEEDTNSDSSDDSEDHGDFLNVDSKGIDCEYDDWQKINPVACNSFHEMSMVPYEDSFYIIGCGGHRCAIKIQDMTGNAFVMKAPKFEMKQSRVDWESSRKDVLIMEELTSSPYVVDIWGSCALSHFEEFGGNGDLHDRIKLAREYHQEMSPLDKLRTCVQISTAVADMHDLGVAHNDICCNQIILVDGIYKLNDFNLAMFQRRNKRTKVPCLDGQINWNDRIAKERSPEEIGEPWHVHWYYNHQKIDDYMLGNVMYSILTNLWTFEGHTVKEAIRIMRRGQRSHMPAKYLNSNDPAIQAIIVAIRACWKQNPFKRPSSRQVADALLEELQRIEQIDKLGIVRVSLSPLPKKFRFTDSDFQEHLVQGYPGEDDLFFNGELLATDDNSEWNDSSSSSSDDRNK